MLHWRFRGSASGEIPQLGRGATAGLGDCGVDEIGVRRRIDDGGENQEGNQDAGVDAVHGFLDEDGADERQRTSPASGNRREPLRRIPAASKRRETGS